MKILHVWDMAGVGSLHAKYQRGLGHNSKVIYRSINKNEFTVGISVRGSAMYFGIAVFIQLMFMRPHIIHIHGWLRGIGLIHRFKKILFLSSKIVFHGHGSEMFEHDPPFSTKLYPHVDYWIASTPNISSKEVPHIAVPVDVNFIQSIRDMNITRTKGSALFVSKYPVDMTDQALAFAKKHDLTLEIHDGFMTKPPLSFTEFITKLFEVEYYLDMKGSTSIRDNQISKAGFESLYAGCKLVDDRELICSNIDEITKMDSYSLVMDIYKDLIQ